MEQHSGGKKRRVSGTGRRLSVAFGLLLGVFSIASWFALSGLAEVRASLAAVREREDGVRLALQLASAVRDQYAHQAHTIIIGDTSHLGFYAGAHAHVTELTRQLRERCRSDQERSWIDQIERASEQLDELFSQRVVPAVIAGDAELVRYEHDRGQLVVSQEIQTLVDQLVASFEGSIRELEQHAGAVQESTWRTTVGSLIAMLLLAVGVGIYITRSIAVPVARLSGGARRLAEGDLSTRLDDGARDEFGDLARQFDAMAASLAEHQRRLVQSEKLAGIGQLAAGVAHEINNPLGVILGYARLLEKKADGPLAEDLKVIEDEVLRCKEIVEGLLDLSRPARIEPRPVDLRDLCEEIAERLRSTRRLSGVEVHVAGEATAAGDLRKLRQVVFNLMKNAAEAADGQGTVEVTLGSGPAGVEVAVADPGPGLSVEARARLFEPFFTTKPNGTGLGLAVSQALARAHGGGIEADAAPVRGAVFRLRLPAGAAECRPQEAKANG